jgi:uncharacterized membrane protein YedE/YeeE
MPAVPLLFLAFGATFGYLLSRAGATDYDAYAGLFLFENPQLVLVIGGAVVVGLVGVAVIERRPPVALVGRGPLDLSRKPMQRGLFLGAVLFGIGWGLAGACPGTALAMLGQGKLTAGVTVAGILAGTWLYGRMQDRTVSPADTPSTRTSIDRPG